MKKNKICHWIVVASLLLILLPVAACSSPSDQLDSPGQETDLPAETAGSSGGTTEGSGDNDTESGTDIDPLDAAQQEWQNSAHADAFVVDDKGVNNPCARCHSPKNWMPSLDDIPESCQACKFELAPPPPFIAESAWENVSCAMCHQADKKGNVQPEVSWLEIPQLGEYASVETHSDLCLKCHDTEGVADHGQVLVGSGHEGMQCTECHSPHSTTATCVTGDCHSDVLSDTDEIPGHDEDHKDVSCAACHDTAGWEVGPHPETGVWVTYSPWSLIVKAGEEDTVSQTGIVPFSSHDLGLEVNCGRCHFSGNPWGLIETVETP